MGWDGFYDLEIFSDNGAFGIAYPDSLWDLDAAELAAGAGGFHRVLVEKEGRGMRPRAGEEKHEGKQAGALGARVVAAAALVLAATAAARTHRRREEADRHRLGDDDSTGPMAPFDAPALAAAKIRVAQINEKGGVDGA